MIGVHRIVLFRLVLGLVHFPRRLFRRLLVWWWLDLPFRLFLSSVDIYTVAHWVAVGVDSFISVVGMVIVGIGRILAGMWL